MRVKLERSDTKGWRVTSGPAVLFTGKRVDAKRVAKTPEDGTRYKAPMEAFDAFQRAGAGTRKQFDLKPITIA